MRINEILDLDISVKTVADSNPFVYVRLVYLNSKEQVMRVDMQHEVTGSVNDIAFHFEAIGKHLHELVLKAEQESPND